MVYRHSLDHTAAAHDKGEAASRFETVGALRRSEHPETPALAKILDGLYREEAEQKTAGPAGFYRVARSALLMMTSNNT